LFNIIKIQIVIRERADAFTRHTQISIDCYLSVQNKFEKVAWPMN
jgi:hypothetical protein